MVLDIYQKGLVPWSIIATYMAGKTKITNYKIPGGIRNGISAINVKHYVIYYQHYVIYYQSDHWIYVISMLVSKFQKHYPKEAQKQSGLGDLHMTDGSF